MNINRVVLEPAFVLHTRTYRDTSLLVDLFTKRHGRLRIVARGVRGVKSKYRGIFMPFMPLVVSYTVRGELGSLQHAEADSMRYELKGKNLLSGFYLNELIIKLLPLHESYSDVYQSYQDALVALCSDKNPELALRLFEKSLLKHLGYGLSLTRTRDNQPILSDQEYVFEYGCGFSLAKAKDGCNFSGKNLLALDGGTLLDQESLREAKRLLCSVVAKLLDNKPIKSRELWYGVRS